MTGNPASLFGALAAALGRAVARTPAAAVHGGCISRSWRWETAAGPVFVKEAPADGLDMLEAERQGLLELQSASAVRVPTPLATGAFDGGAFLALEWIDFGETSAPADERLGEQLAALHRHRAARFGLERDNTVGSTAQPNAWCSDWVAFWRERRLGFQLDLAAAAGHGSRLQERGRRLMDCLDVFFATYRPAPSLLHGDLWGGNRGVDVTGQPVIYDPAVYYGDRESDLAMTRLFGGFGRAFYDAYESEWPLPSGHRQRSDLYQLYHVLNHLNLFGSGYLGRARELINRLI